MGTTRRAVVAGTATAGATAALSGIAVAPAQAAGFVPRAYTATLIPSASTLHVIRRFSSGYTPALRREVVAAGGAQAWFERQLALGYDDAWCTTTAAWWPSINATPAVIWQRHQDDVEELWQADANYQAWAVMRRIGSRRQVLEVMAEFWESHFNVPAVGDVGPFRTAYGRAIRGRALGTFTDLLPTAVLHPAMAVYLDNANSSKDAPNENLGRELLELHTVGIGNYTEDDVKASARILTGYTLDEWDTWTYSYDPGAHATGPVQVMGFSHANGAPDGRPVVAAYLSYLAHHPATARHLARKLAVRFVSDDPSDALVAHLADVYLSSGTAIKPVLRAILGSAEFKASAGTKVRNPTEDVVATWRALGARLSAPAGIDDAAANAVVWQCDSLGLTPFGWAPPDGRPDDAVSWSSTARFLASLDLHYTMSGGWWPTTGAAYLKAKAWLPVPQVRFDQLVDHIARTMHGRGSTSLLLQVACQATGCRPADLITAQHGLVRWDMARLLTVFLDNPIHMSR